jgi:hypothetical protein
MKTSIKFIPNEDDNRPKDAFIKLMAEVTRQDPETLVVVPFSELEGSITKVDSNLRIDGQPVTMDVAGDYGQAVGAEETPSVLGETLADELESFDPLHPTDIVKETTAHIVSGMWEGSNEPVVITSEEDITKLEQQATGE